MSLQYTVHLIPPSSAPSNPNPTLLPYLAGKFSSLRLSALEDSPNSFSATFETESSYPLSTWISRLLRPQFSYYICIAHSSSTPTSSHTIDSGLFVGSVQLFGPSPSSFFELPESGAPTPLSDDDQESKYQMLALYTSPHHRGKGLAKKLILGAIENAKEEAQKQGKERVRIRLFIHPENLGARKLYAELGFADAGLVTLAEAVVQNGDAESLPVDGGKSDPERWLKRIGLGMEWVG